MNEANAKKLVDAFPHLYKQIQDFECEDGWFTILHDLSAQLEREILALEKPDEYYAVQIKEKFGTLSVYMSQYTDTIDQLIREAETRSKTTCEECGAPGEIRSIGWLRCRCDACRPTK